MQNLKRSALPITFVTFITNEIGDEVAQLTRNIGTPYSLRLHQMNERQNALMLSPSRDV